MKPEVTLLITCMGGSVAPAILVELVKSEFFKYRLIGVNVTGPVPAQRILDAFYRVPAGTCSEFVPAMLEVARRERVDVVLPWSDDEAFSLSASRLQFAAFGTRILVSPMECLELISDKLSTYDYLKNAGITVPEYRAVENTHQLLNALSHYGYPERTVVLKPKKGRGNRGIHILCGKDSPPAWLGSGKREKRIETPVREEDRLASFMEGETLVMPCLRAPAYDVDVLHKGPEQYSIYVRKRRNPTGIPYQGNTLIVDAPITEYCRKIAETLQLGALHDMDLMTTGDGVPVILEVNPRPSGSLISTMSAGYPVLDWAVAKLLDIKCEMTEPREEIEIVAANCTFPMLESPR